MLVSRRYTTFDDFQTLIVQFGYVSLFVVAFPLAPLLALVSNVIESRLDARAVRASAPPRVRLWARVVRAAQVVRSMARPVPRGAENIGVCVCVCLCAPLPARYAHVPRPQGRGTTYSRLCPSQRSSPISR